MTKPQEQLQKTLDEYSLRLDSSGKYTSFFQIIEKGEMSRKLYIRDNEYEIVLSERAKPFLQKTFFDTDELLYWLTTEALKNIVSQNTERKRKDEPLSEYLKMFFQRKKELMHMINDEWAERAYSEGMDYTKRLTKNTD